MIIGLSFLLLMIAFRSFLVPLKAAVMNLLSIGAAYGVVVMVFQYGWFSGLVGLEGSVPIVSYLPLALMGRAAWWLPSRLDRRLPQISVEGQRLLRGSRRRRDRRRLTATPARRGPVRPAPA